MSALDAPDREDINSYLHKPTMHFISSDQQIVMDKLDLTINSVALLDTDVQAGGAIQVERRAPRSVAMVILINTSLDHSVHTDT